MKGIQLGYEQMDNGEKIYAKIPLRFYEKFISAISKQNIPNQKSVLKFYKHSSSSGNKYALKFNNFFYFKINQESLNNHNKIRSIKNNNDKNKIIKDNKKEDGNKNENQNETNNNEIDSSSSCDNIYKFNLEIAKKSKIINSINFEMSPLLKVSLNNLIKLKYGNYHGSNYQPILFNNKLSNNKTQYDFSTIFPSMIPYRRFGLCFNTSFYNDNKNNAHNLKISYNKIFDYESNIKFSNILKSNYIFNIFENIIRF